MIQRAAKDDGRFQPDEVTPMDLLRVARRPNAAAVIYECHDGLFANVDDPAAGESWNCKVTRLEATAIRSAVRKADAKFECPTCSSLLWSKAEMWLHMRVPCKREEVAVDNIIAAPSVTLDCDIRGCQNDPRRAIVLPIGKTSMRLQLCDWHLKELRTVAHEAASSRNLVEGGPEDPRSHVTR